MGPARRPEALYCSPACSTRARSARYRASARGRATAAAYRANRAQEERARARRRSAESRLREQSARLERVRASVDAEVPRTAGQIEAVREHIAALSTRVDEVTAERDAALVDARQLARLVRHLFLTTGAAGFARPGVQALLALHLTAADRRHLPAAHTEAHPAGPSPTSAHAGAADDHKSGGAAWR
jgi:hypothetical protein